MSGSQEVAKALRHDPNDGRHPPMPEKTKDNKVGDSRVPESGDWSTPASNVPTTGFLSPASPAMSLTSPVIPGGMPIGLNTSLGASYVEQQGETPTTPKAARGSTNYASPAGLSSGLTSFFRTLSMSSSSAAAPATSNAQPSPSNSKLGTPDNSLSSRPSTASSGISNTDSPTSPGGINFGGGAQIRRALSQSSATRRMRKISGTLPSLLGGSTPSPGARNGPEIPNDGNQTPTQANSSNPGIISSSISFLSGLASLDRLPPLLGLVGGGEKDAYPRGTDRAIDDEDSLHEQDLRLDEATADGETFQETSVAPPVSRTGTLATLDSETSTRYPLSPAASISTSGPLTFTSSSSGSVASSTDSTGDNEGLPMASSATARPESGRIAHQRRQSNLDPLTFQAISRKSSEADALRVSQERANRGRELDFRERLQGQSVTSRMDSTSSTSQSSASSTNALYKPASTAEAPLMADPTTPQAKKTRNELGLGLPTSPASPARVTQSTPLAEGKTSRRKSLLGRLGFSPSNKSASSKSSPSKGSTPPVPSIPTVHLHHSQSASSFGSFAAVAEATPSGQPRSRADSRLSEVGFTELNKVNSNASNTAFPGVGGSSYQSTQGGEYMASGASSRGHRNRYIKTKVKNKSKREFNHLFLAQELSYANGSANNTPTTAVPSLVTSPSTSELPLPSPPYQYASYPESPAKTPATTGTASKIKTVRTSTVAIWCLKFSPDGNYLASAGQDGVVRVWQVVSGHEEREAAILAMQNGGAGAVAPEIGASLNEVVSPVAKHFEASGSKISKKDKRASRVSTMSTSTTGHCPVTCFGEGGKCCTPGNHINQASRTSYAAPVFAHKPLHEWKGHTSDVLDLSWSKNNFLLSSSMDKTVRLWHISRKECLCAFQHLDFVTSIAFHPKDDRYFISGSLDAKLRLWSIPDKKVHCWTQLPELITCVSFTTDGKLAIAGTFVGLCFFFDVRDLSFVTKLHSKSSRGKNAKGQKITSIVAIPKGEPSEPERLLITSNDSRMRLWNINHIVTAFTSPSGTTPTIPKIITEKFLEAKYRFHENTSSQIKATFSDDGRYVISGSEDRQAYIWQSGLLDFPSPFAQTSKKTADKSPGCESFTPASGVAGGVAAQSSAIETGTSGPAVAGGIVTCAIFAPVETRLTIARGGDPLLGGTDEEEEGGEEGRPTSHMQRSASYASTTSSLQAPPSTSGHSEEGSTTSATAMSAEGCIIVTADDQSGIIRIYRNNPVFARGAGGQLRDRKNSNATDRSETDKRASFFSNRRASQISKTSRTAGRTRTSTNDRRGGSDMEELA